MYLTYSMPANLNLDRVIQNMDGVDVGLRWGSVLPNLLNFFGQIIESGLATFRVASLKYKFSPNRIVPSFLSVKRVLVEKLNHTHIIIVARCLEVRIGIVFPDLVFLGWAYPNDPEAERFSNPNQEREIVISEGDIEMGGIEGIGSHIPAFVFVAGIISSGGRKRTLSVDEASDVVSVVVVYWRFFVNLSKNIHDRILGVDNPNRSRYGFEVNLSRLCKLVYRSANLANAKQLTRLAFFKIHRFIHDILHGDLVCIDNTIEMYKYKVLLYLGRLGKTYFGNRSLAFVPVARSPERTLNNG